MLTHACDQFKTVLFKNIYMQTNQRELGITVNILPVGKVPISVSGN